MSGSADTSVGAPARHVAGELFLVSWLILFLELACIRWFPAHVLFLTFFTNVVLLACFVGMSVGCLAAGHRRNYLIWTAPLLLLALLAGQLVQPLRERFRVGFGMQQVSPQMVYFGSESGGDVGTFVVPIEAVTGLFFLLIALVMLGLGQELGRALDRAPDRVRAYTLNIAGSLAGIALFSLFSWAGFSPVWWFATVAVGLGYLLIRRGQARSLPQALVLALLVVVAAVSSGDRTALGGKEYFWSPYYRIDYLQDTRWIAVNLIGHQQMSPRESPAPAYALPHLLRRDSGATPYRDVLIIGGGSGNDVSRALEAGAEHIDVVEIDPIIRRLGNNHPDKPYDDPRVTVHLDDGRNFLRAGERQYDLIIYALVDSLVLHSSYSNIRLESYLFTEEAFRDVKRRLRPDGQFVMYNFFRQGWIVARVANMLTDVFGAPPLVLSLPDAKTITPDEDRPTRYTVFIAGDTERLRDAFAAAGRYWLPVRESPGLVKTNGFRTPSPEERKILLAGKGKSDGYHLFGLAEVVMPAEPLRPATDDWPFLYLRHPLIPNLSLRGMAIMAGLSILLLCLFRPRNVLGEATGGARERWLMAGRMFFLGAGFMLMETKAVVHMALLFGSTWMVNALVFGSVLLMILLANLFVLRFRPARLGPFYIGLVLTLALNAVVPMGAFLGMGQAVQVLGSCLLVFVPIGFAAVIFAVSFDRSAAPDLAFGANIAGALLGGLTENASMVVGFRYLVLVALALYLLAFAFRLPAARREALPAPLAPQGLAP